MKVYALFHGGNGYSSQKDIEVFDSLKGAKDAFWRRTCTDESAEMTIWFDDPRNPKTGPDDLFDLPYPDRLIVLES